MGKLGHMCPNFPPAYISAFTTQKNLGVSVCVCAQYPSFFHFNHAVEDRMLKSARGDEDKLSVMAAMVRMCIVSISPI